jgi:hypothetical protein
MEIKKFIFVPDGHYGYPESTGGEEPLDYDTLVEDYCGSGYSAWNQGDFDLDEEPDSDDFETSEEYDEAYAEWEESQKSYKEDCYDEYGSFDVFGNSYEMLANTDVDPDRILDRVFDYEGTSCHDDFMQEAAVTEGVVYVISRGSDDEIAVAGQVYPLDSTSQELSDMLSDTIVKEYRNKNPKAGVMYKDISSSIPGVYDKVREKLSPEEYDDLVRAGKGGSMLRRFGID